MFSLSLGCIGSSQLRFQFSEVVGSRGTIKPPAETCPLFGQCKMLECQLMGCVLCPFRINLDIIRMESSTNLKKLLELQRKVLSSNDDMKQQYEKPIQVSHGAPLYLPIPPTEAVCNTYTAEEAHERVRNSGTGDAQIWK